MCTAIGIKKDGLYFGRTLDIECSYGEKVLITPRNYRFSFKYENDCKSHFAIMGAGIQINNYPLYYEAVNECGLCMAGLNFPKSAHYAQPQTGKHAVPSYEFIPWILAKCKRTDEAELLVKETVITDDSFSEKFPAATLHWIIADAERAITVESVKDGIKIYDNPFYVMANEPPFDFHTANISNYLSLSPRRPPNTFSDKVALLESSMGLGAFGLPGDLSSPSRFVRASFHALNSVGTHGGTHAVNQLFHVFDTVSQPMGSNVLDSGVFEISLYTCVIDAKRRIYYYRTYDNSRITAVFMDNENLDFDKVIEFKFNNSHDILWQN